MNYRKAFFQYAGLTGLFAILWYWLERNFLYNQGEYGLFTLIIGTHSGYGYYLIIPSVFMLLFLVIVRDTVTPFSVLSVLRLGRRCAFQSCFWKLVQICMCYSFVYVIVQVAYALVYIDWELLMAAGFLTVMAMYYVVVSAIFSFGGMLYLMLYVVCRNSVLSIAVTIAVNMWLAHYLKLGILYGGLTIIDDMTAGNDINPGIWMLNQLIHLCIIWIIYIVTETIYEKKDIL